ncbi:Ribonuclease H domain [Dillenia turbinata]|uniref:Ribonuclease H domain n=1 Tax=Dillenia turbinata TaxID=194707 RepID=A0AAN8Z8Q1_9MAGN
MEVDSMAVVNLLRESSASDHPLGDIIRECQELMAEVNVVQIRYIYREGSKCADHLAVLGHDCISGPLEFSSPLPTLLRLMQDDMRGVKSLRSEFSTPANAPTEFGLSL